jgi:AcrR family transcriptional regulator
MQPRKERKLQLREAAIIEAAARLIERVGYTHLTMDMLSEEAGIAKATLYQHFKSKEDVVIASSRRALANLERFMAECTGSAVEKLRAIMRYMMLSSYDADGFPMMVMHDEVLNVFRDDTEAGQTFGRLNTDLFKLVEQAKRDGDIAPELPNEVIITMMMNTIPVAKGRMVYDAMQPQDVLIGHALRIFFNGLKP